MTYIILYYIYTYIIILSGHSSLFEIQAFLQPIHNAEIYSSFPGVEPRRMPLLSRCPRITRYSMYLLYWYKSTNTDAVGAGSVPLLSRRPHTHIMPLPHSCRPQEGKKEEKSGAEEHESKRKRQRMHTEEEGGRETHTEKEDKERQRARVRIEEEGLERGTHIEEEGLERDVRIEEEERATEKERESKRKRERVRMEEEGTGRDPNQTQREKGGAEDQRGWGVKKKNEEGPSAQTEWGEEIEAVECSAGSKPLATELTNPIEQLAETEEGELEGVDSFLFSIGVSPLRTAGGKKKARGITESLSVCSANLSSCRANLSSCTNLSSNTHSHVHSPTQEGWRRGDMEDEATGGGLGDRDTGIPAWMSALGLSPLRIKRQ
jgi:hypothetical protein